jgi:CARDB protein
MESRLAPRTKARRPCELSLESLESRLLLDATVWPPPPATCPVAVWYMDMDPAGDYHWGHGIYSENEVHTVRFSPETATTLAGFSGTTPGSDLDIRMALYDSGLNSTGDFNDDIGGQDRDSYFEANVEQDATYVLRVDGVGPSTGSYEVVIDTGNPAITRLFLDGNGMMTAAARVNRPGDHDFLLVTAPPDMTYLHTWTSGGLRTKLTVYTFDGANYTRVSEDVGNLNADIELVVNPGQDYYIALTGVTGSIGPTGVNVDFDARPDLMGTYFHADSPVDWGQTFNVDVGVWNGGTGASGWAAAEFYLSNDIRVGDPDDIFLGWTGIDPLDPYGWVLLNDIALTMPAGPTVGYDTTSDMYVNMVLDRTALVPETDETNNWGEGEGLDLGRVQQPAADLVGTFFDSDEPLEWGQTFYVDAGVWNGGTGWSGWAPVEFYLSDDATFGDGDDVFLGWEGVNPLAPYDWTLITDKALVLPGAMPAGYSEDTYIGMVIDRTDFVDELSEDNNSNQGDGLDLDQVGPPMPDLYGTYFDTPQPLHWGETFAVDVGVYNGGTAWSGWATVDFYVSPFYAIHSIYPWLGWASIEPLPPGGWTTIWQHSLTLPDSPPYGFTTPDEVYIGMIVDLNDWVTESDEGNNSNHGVFKDLDWAGILAGAPSVAPSTAPGERVDALVGALAKSAVGGVGLTAANLAMPGDRVFDLLADQTLLGAHDRSALEMTDLDKLFSFGDGLALIV